MSPDLVIRACQVVTALLVATAIAIVLTLALSGCPPELRAAFNQVDAIDQPRFGSVVIHFRQVGGSDAEVSDVP